MPAVGALDNPAPGRVARVRRRGRRRGLSAPPLVWGMDEVAPGCGRLPRLVKVEALVPTQVLRGASGGTGPPDHDAVQGGFGRLHVGAVGGAEPRAQGGAAAIAQHMALGALLAPIGR